MKRREFLENAGSASLLLAARSLIGFEALLPGCAHASLNDPQLPLAALQSALSPSDGLILVPTSAQYAQYQTAFNLRTVLKPQARVLCNNAQAVGTAIQWAKANKIPFAIRCGGHSYEGFSQSASVVIDQRLLNKIELDPSGDTFTAGGGCALEDIYTTVGAKGLGFNAGSCPTVGIAGHLQGGGFGLLGRPFGLACDSLIGAEVVDANGKVLNLPDDNPDLFWAIRGGGGGSFCIVTKFHLQAHPVRQLAVFGLSWAGAPAQMLKVMKAWQSWIASAPDSITCIFRLQSDAKGLIELRCAGQSTDAESKLPAQLATLINAVKPSSFTHSTLDFLSAIKHFAGQMTYPTCYMKGKSDYLFTPLSDEGILAMMNGLLKLPTGSITPICDSYGGAIARVAPDATAFAHRKALFQIQYYSSWTTATGTPSHLANIKSYYDSLRPFMSGNCYVNYPDSDLASYPTAYWGANLARLQQIKAAVDPGNLFQHRQSVPLPSS